MLVLDKQFRYTYIVYGSVSHLI